jgi:hypothetical protein
MYYLLLFNGYANALQYCTYIVCLVRVIKRRYEKDSSPPDPSFCLSGLLTFSPLVISSVHNTDF